MTAAERFKRLFANAIERVCILEEQLETAQARINELEKPTTKPSKPPANPSNRKEAK